MRKFLLITAAAVTFSAFAPVASMAQGIAVETPIGGVRVGESEYYHPSWGYAAPRYRDRDERVVIQRRVYRDRDDWRWHERNVRMHRWHEDD